MTSTSGSTGPLSPPTAAQAWNALTKTQPAPGPQAFAEVDVPPSIAIDAFVTQGTFGTAQERRTMAEKYDTDGFDGLSESEFEQLYNEMMVGPEPETYTVKPGDSLKQIAAHLLGDPGRWKELHALNQNVIGPNPDLIRAGQVLQLPGDTSATVTQRAPTAEQSIPFGSGTGINQQVLHSELLPDPGQLNPQPAPNQVLPLYPPAQMTKSPITTFSRITRMC